MSIRSWSFLAIGVAAAMAAVYLVVVALSPSVHQPLVERFEAADPSPRQEAPETGTVRGSQPTTPLNATATGNNGHIDRRIQAHQRGLVASSICPGERLVSERLT